MLGDFRAIVAPDVAASYRAAGWWADGTFADRVSELAQDRGADLAYVTADHRMSWAQLDACSDRLAGGLIAAGVAPGERIGVLLGDSPTIHVVLIALEKSGATAVGIGVRAGEREIHHLLGRTGATTVITGVRHRDQDSEPLVRQWMEVVPSLRRHVVVPEFEADPNGHVTVDGQIVPTVTITREQRLVRHVGADDLFLINSTSGTTGLPKCVTHTQNRWRYFHGQAVANAGLDRDDVFFSACPTPFGFGLWTSHATPILLGVPTVLCERFSAEATLDLIERERVSVLCCVSTQFIMILESPTVQRRDLSSLRVMFTGGETVPYERALAWERSTGSKVLQFYGSNETGLLSGTTVDDPPERRLRTAGRVVADMAVRLYLDGCDVTSSGYGQAACRGPATTAGYLDDPDANRALRTADGWMLMADLCRIDDEGYLSVVGRISDIIIRGGKNISAAQVEAEAVSHPAVALAAAVPMSDPVFGERVCLYAQLRPGASLTLDDLVHHLRTGGVGPDLFPERLIVIDELPIASGGKVAKGQLVRDLRLREKS
jgi:acyl-CoA synthetase